MADSTGPISTLPGSRHTPPEGMKCDDCGALATIRVQGETDSFGCEMHDLCKHCFEKEKTELQEEHPSWCDWCKQQVAETFPKRDYEEGMCGPVYYVCSPCSTAYNKRVNEELALEESYYDDYYDDWED